MALPKLHGRVHIGLPELHGRIHIGLPELHRRFSIDPPKWSIRFRIVPPQVSHSIWSHYISTVGDFFDTMAIMQEKQQKTVFEIEWRIYPLGRSQGQKTLGPAAPRHRNTALSFPHNVAV